MEMKQQRIRKNTTLILSIILMLMQCQINLYANYQAQVENVSVDEVHYVNGENIITNEAIIRPTITMSWEEPSGGWSTLPLSSEVHEPDFYDITINNLTTGASPNNVRINKNSDEYNAKSVAIHDKVNIETGSLLEITVVPQHYHAIEGGEGVIVATSTGNVEKAYAITDLDVEFIPSEESIQVIWDDLGSDQFDYRIVYALGDYSGRSKQDLLDNKEGQVEGINSEHPNVTKFYDTEDRRNKLSYTISEGIFPGQVYSIMVETTTDTYLGEDVMLNRNYPPIKSTSTNVVLDIFEEGDYLRFEWDVPGTFKVGKDKDEYSLVEAALLEINEGKSSNIAIFDSDAAVIGYYKIPKPSNAKDFKISFVYEAVDEASKEPISPQSDDIHYVPSELQIIPTKPVVPKMMTQDMLDTILMQNAENLNIAQQIIEKDYLIKGMTYDEKLDNILEEDITFHVNTDTRDINFIWGAFERVDVNSESPTYLQTIYDHDIYYDIWVTRALEDFENATRVVTDGKYDDLTPDNTLVEGDEIIGFRTLLSQYYDDQTGELEPIEPNSLYYIRIVAKKKTAKGDMVSEPTIVSLYYGYDGAVYAPQTLSKPPLFIKEQETSDQSISLNWQEKWFEVMSPDANEDEVFHNWEHEVWVQADGTITNTKVDNAKYFPLYKDEDAMNEFDLYIRDLDDSWDNTLIRREIDLGKNELDISDIKYKLHRIPYENVLSTIASRDAEDEDVPYTFENYYNDLVLADKDETSIIPWRDIETEVDQDDSSLQYFRDEALTPNTTYLFLLYPYRELFTGEVLMAHYPTPIIGSTNPEDYEVNPDPKVPNLYVSSKSDTEIRLKWKYNTDFRYEIVSSVYDDINEASLVEWELPEDPLDDKYPVNGEYYEIIVDDLFPDTGYYFWIRSIEEGESKTSHWSNSLAVETHDVSSPVPPQGFGLASEENMKRNGFSESVTHDYVAVEWVKDSEDIEVEGTRKVTKRYTYIIEVSDNKKFIDPEYIESSGGKEDIKPDTVDILEKNLIKINELVANRPYYIRVKTKLIVEGSEDGQYIEKESATYTPSIKIITIDTGDEYDGNVDPDLEVLPEEDYELIYDKSNDILTFRFRDSGTDLDGNSDNNVSQRLIRKLMVDNTYVYTIDVSAYEEQNINRRTVVIPYSVMEAFKTHQVDLLVNAGDVSIHIPEDAIEQEFMRQRNIFGVTPTVKIIIETYEISDISVNKPKEADDSPIISEEISIEVTSEKTRRALRYADEELTVNFKTDEKKASVYTMDHRNKWEKENPYVDVKNKQLTIKTANLGPIVVANRKNTNPTIVSDTKHWSNEYRDYIFKKYNVNGLDRYDPEAKVSERAVLNVIYSMVLKETTVDLNAPIYSEQVDTLKKAGIKKNASINRTTISREEAISLFVNAYEIIHDKTIKIDTDVWTKINKDTSINSMYKEDIAKALSSSILDTSSNIRGKEALKYGELFKLWARQ